MARGLPAEVPRLARMRVLAYADGIAYSGAEAAFASLLSGLAGSEGVELSVAVAPGRLARELRGRGVEIAAELPALALRAGLTAFDPRLRRARDRIVRRIGPDAVLANLPSAEAGTSALGSGVPTVAYLHIPHSLAHAGFRCGPVRDRLAAPRLRRANRIVVPAPSTRRWAIEFWGFPPEQVGWAPPPSREPRALGRETARAVLGLDAAAPLIGLLGRLSIKQKGHDVALRALARPALAALGAELVIAGDGPDREAIHRLAREAGVEPRVHFVGRLADPDALYAAIDAIAIPSRFEGLPLVALECLKLGVAGVVSAIDGLADVWPERWQSAPGDGDALARALAGVLDEPPSARRALVAARWAEIAPSYDDGVAPMRAQLRATLGGGARDQPALA